MARDSKHNAIYDDTPVDNAAEMISKASSNNECLYISQRSTLTAVHLFKR